jgi:hypothetical protein
MRNFVRSYIVRVYRPQKKGSETISGLVEDPERGTRRAFRSFDELRFLLGSRRPEDPSHRRNLRKSAQTSAEAETGIPSACQD